jgi:hypothetical protein
MPASYISSRSDPSSRPLPSALLHLFRSSALRTSPIQALLALLLLGSGAGAAGGLVGGVGA